MPARALALLAVLVVALGVAAYRLNHDRARWSPDGPIYLRMALQDRGAPPDAALRESNRYARENTTLGADPQTRDFYGDAPPAYYRDQARLFVTRPLYPALGALLLPRFGPGGLKLVSAAGYVAAAVLLYLLLLAFVPPWLAAFGAAALALTPDVQDLAAMPLTDALALCFWIAALAALLAYLRAPTPARLSMLVAATALLTFTRPAVYLPLGAALAVWLTAPRGSATRRAGGAATLAVIGVGLVFAAYTLLVHGPGLAAQLRWIYDTQVATHGPFVARGFAGWWVLASAAGFAEVLTLGIYKFNLLPTVLLAGFGLALVWRTTTAAVLIGAAMAALAAVVLNPGDVARPVGVPLAPLLIVAATIALAALWSKAVERRAAEVSR